MSDESDFLWHEGKKYLRVSAVAGSFNDYSKVPPQVLKNKQNVGTVVHKAIEDDLNDDLPYIPHSCMGYFRSYNKWRKRVSPYIMQNETRYYNDELMLTGCIDCLAVFPYETVPSLIDWKTSANESPSWVYQAHLYFYLLNACNIEVSKRFVFVKLDSMGSNPQIFEYSYNSNTQDVMVNLVKKYWKNMENVSQKFPIHGKFKA